MADHAHVAYCFENLVAELEDRDFLTLFQTQDLWTRYRQTQDAYDAKVRGGKNALPVDEAGDQDSHTDSLLEDVDAELEKEKASLQRESRPSHEPESSRPVHPTLQLPSIARLQASSAASGSSSSLTSTNSSTAALGDTSKSSSNSSFPSLGSSKQASPATPAPDVYPLFVTWNTLSSQGGQKSLRGCIGTFDAKELEDGLSEYALTAAFKDSRFAPITLSELPTLSCSVTLLTNFTSCASLMDWTVGTHGIKINFYSGHRRMGATYLPDVASEQGWTKEEALMSLMRKAGWSGRSRDWRDAFERGRGNVVRYEGRKASMNWTEWARWREWTRRIGYE